VRVRVERERERGKDIRIYTYIYIYTHMFVDLFVYLFVYIERDESHPRQYPLCRGSSRSSLCGLGSSCAAGGVKRNGHNVIVLHLDLKP
jgi:hypothetical protein